MTYNKQTWVDGVNGNTPINSARLNYMETGIEAAAADVAYGVLEGNTATWSLATNTNTVVPLNVSVLANGITVDTAQNRITITKAGVYLISGAWSIAAPVVNTRHIAFIYKNGVVVAQSQNRSDPAVANTHIISTTTYPIRLIAGDYLQLGARQDGGAAKNVDLSLGAFLQATFIAS